MTGSPTPPAPHGPAVPRRQLSLVDSTAIIVGIIIGAGIYESTPGIAGNAGSTSALVAVWLLCGLLSLAGAMCYVDLLIRCPEPGGDYVFLNRAFGRHVAFLYAWAQFWVVRPGANAALAFVFGRYAQRIFPLPGPYPFAVYACAALVGLSAINIVGVHTGKWTQNALTLLKVLGMAAVFVAALAVGSPAAPALSAAAKSSKPDFMLAMIVAMFVFGGWSDVAFVGAEVRHPEKNIFRALVLGLAVVTAVYVAISLAFAHVLSYRGLVESKAVAADTLQAVFSSRGLGAQRAGDLAARAISALICLSALGAINGQLFAGARIFYAFGKDHTLFGPVGTWNRRFGTPVWSLAAQGAASLLWTVLFGTPLWSIVVGAAAKLVRRPGVKFDPNTTFQQLVIFTTPPAWLFFLATGVSLFVLRWKRPASIPFRMTGFPIAPMVFCISAAFLFYSSLVYAWYNASYEAFWSVGLLLLGLPFLALVRRPDGASERA
ncbi:MAG: amino acid permease [Planctomycetia bacterium]|nr:amino acid permease [Planctomycetia bacterium]